MVIFCHMTHSADVIIDWFDQLTCFIVHFAFAAWNSAALLVSWSTVLSRNHIGSWAEFFTLPFLPNCFLEQCFLFFSFVFCCFFFLLLFFFFSFLFFLNGQKMILHDPKKVNWNLKLNFIECPIIKHLILSPDSLWRFCPWTVC